MIAIESVSASQFTEHSLPVAMEFAVRCQADLDFTITTIMTAMGQYPFSASDGFAVQFAVSEALRTALLQIGESSADLHVRVRTHVTTQFVRVQLEEVRNEPEVQIPPAFSQYELGTQLSRRSVQLMRTYMTSVEVRKQGRQLILYRARGQGSAISGPPIGYDFQI